MPPLQGEKEKSTALTGWLGSRQNYATHVAMSGEQPMESEDYADFVFAAFLRSAQRFLIISEMRLRAAALIERTPRFVGVSAAALTWRGVAPSEEANNSNAVMA